MDIAKINRVLDLAPQKATDQAKLEIEQRAIRDTAHIDYKRLRAKKALELKAKKEENKLSEKDREYTLDIDEELCKIEDMQLQAEIKERAYKVEKEYFEKKFESAKAQSYNYGTELKMLGDTVSEPKRG